MPSIRTVGWSWQEAHTVISDSVWEYVTIHAFCLLPLASCLLPWA
ncbi:hypothetical protein [Moorena producens]|nr:hypothetical protein [Moorena producens]